MVGFLHDTTGAKKWWGWTVDMFGSPKVTGVGRARLSFPCPDGSELIEETIWEVENEAVDPGTMLGGSIDLGSGSIGV